MKQYLDIVEHILEHGKVKGNRTGIDTLACPNMFFSFDMKNRFPLLTTKRVAFKTLSIELEGFIKGITSKRWYSTRGCNIWNEWGHPERVRKEYENHLYERETMDKPPETALDIKHFQKMEDDLGPIYGYQWRRWNECYDENCNGQLKGIDQLKQIVHTLKTNPNDRRLVVSAWNPTQIQSMALPPCHMMFVLTHIDGELSLHWTQRSCDLMLGVPFNIASYALLLKLLCKESGLRPGNLAGTLCDCHIYVNQIEAAKAQITRTPDTLPKVAIGNTSPDNFDIFSWTHKDIKLLHYNPQSKIDFGPVAV